VERAILDCELAELALKWMMHPDRRQSQTCHEYADIYGNAAP
jgi:hypothetical protein